MVRKPATSQVRSEALKGNQNAVKDETEKVQERKPLTISFTSRRKERLRNAIAWHEGYIPEDDEVEGKARQLCYDAWEVYCDSIEKEQERAIIL